MKRRSPLETPRHMKLCWSIDGKWDFEQSKNILRVLPRIFEDPQSKLCALKFLETVNCMWFELSIFKNTPFKSLRLRIRLYNGLWYTDDMCLFTHHYIKNHYTAWFSGFMWIPLPWKNIIKNASFIMVCLETVSCMWRFSRMRFVPFPTSNLKLWWTFRFCWSLLFIPYSWMYLLCIWFLQKTFFNQIDNSKKDVIQIRIL